MNQNSIFFFTEEISYRFTQIQKTREGLGKLLKAEGKMEGSVNVIFCSDEYLRSVNKRYLGRNYYTDVISFNLSGEDNVVSGDIFISIERVRENARAFRVRVREELNRIIIHGFLHLCGMSDDTDAERSAMRIKEDEYLQLLPV